MLMEVPRYWRLREIYYGRPGFFLIKKGDIVSFGSGPTRPEFPLNGNGRHKEKDPLQNSAIIYQAPRNGAS